MGINNISTKKTGGGGDRRHETRDRRQETGDTRHEKILRQEKILFSFFIVSPDTRYQFLQRTPIRPNRKCQNCLFEGLFVNQSVHCRHVLFSHNFRRRKLESQFARFRVCTRVHVTTGPGSSAGATGNETTEPAHKTAIAVAVPMHRATARGRTSPCASASPADHGRTGRTGGRRRRRIGGGRGDRRRGAAVRGWRQAGLLAGLARSRSVMFAANKGYVPSIPRRSTY